MINGLFHFQFFLLLLLFVYLFAVLFSMMALYAEESTFKRYNTFKDLRKLVIAAFLEPFVFHPVVVYAALKGNWQKLKGQGGWGEMTRKGFVK